MMMSSAHTSTYVYRASPIVAVIAWYKAAVDAYREEKAKLAEEAAAKEAAEKEAERLANPTEADLLKEIRDLLKEKA